MGYESGEPCWVDVASPDPEKSADFYGGLFGWSVVDGGDPEQTGGYKLFELDGKAVAGLSLVRSEGELSTWSTYFATSDADATAAAARAAGGKVLADPFDVPGAGRMAVLQDPADAVFSVWQAGGHEGAALVDQPGSVCWHRLTTRRPEDVRDFYTALFGWRAQEASALGVTFTEWMLGDREIGVMWKPITHFPDHVPNNWLVYFRVDDLDDVTRRAEQGGGFVLAPRMATPRGDMVAIADGHGASFAIIELGSSTEG